MKENEKIIPDEIYKEGNKSTTFRVEEKPETTPKQFGEYILKGLSHPEFKEKSLFFSDIGSEDNVVLVGGCAVTLGLLGYYDNDLSKLTSFYKSNLYVGYAGIAKEINMDQGLAADISSYHWSKTMTAKEIGESLINGTFKLLEGSI